MKRIFSLLLLLCLIVAVPAKAEEVKRDGNNFTVIKTVTNSQDAKTVYTYTIKDAVYPIYITKNGRLIEILRICVTDEEEKVEIMENLIYWTLLDLTDFLLQTYREYKEVIDFSKLEE